jgi:hypothetical protein
MPMSIDDYVRIIKEGNNGGYANDWLIGDRKTGEIAYLELGLKNTPLWRTKEGYFVSSNFPRDPKLIREEASGFDPNDMSSSMNARHARADETGEPGERERLTWRWQRSFWRIISTASSQKSRSRMSEGYVGMSITHPRGVKEWAWDAYNPGGAVQGKATDSAMAANMSFVARAGHPLWRRFSGCGFS